MSEPERISLAVALQMLKQRSSRKLRDRAGGNAFWQKRYLRFQCVQRSQAGGEAALYVGPTTRLLARWGGTPGEKLDTVRLANCSTAWDGWIRTSGMVPAAE